jgi:aspartyl/asparaginyl beta-hydroxylase (cupin superfamily)
MEGPWPGADEIYYHVMQTYFELERCVGLAMTVKSKRWKERKKMIM